MFGLPDGNGVMAFSDTAGANACLSLAFMLQAEGQPTPTLFTNNPGFANNDWALTVNYVDKNDINIDDSNAGYIFTGTSHPDSSRGFELGFIRLGRQLNIPSISFIDHWVNFRVRFEIGGERILPDTIWVLDKKAKEIAITEGLPAEKLLIHKNPQHEYLAKYWRSQFEGYEYLDTLGIHIVPGTRVVLYAPDPLSLRGKSKELGFDETLVLIELVDALSKLPGSPSILLLIKPHPLQPEGKLERVLEYTNENIQVKIIKQAKNTELINCADVIIGIYSNFTLEAKQMHKPVIRYFPASQNLDPLRHLEDIKPVADKESLFSLLNTYLRYE
jgi:hypothetical protein